MFVVAFLNVDYQQNHCTREERKERREKTSSTSSIVNVRDKSTDQRFVERGNRAALDYCASSVDLTRVACCYSRRREGRRTEKSRRKISFLSCKCCFFFSFFSADVFAFIRSFSQLNYSADEFLNKRRKLRFIDVSSPFSLFFGP